MNRTAIERFLVNVYNRYVKGTGVQQVTIYASPGVYRLFVKDLKGLQRFGPSTKKEKEATSPPLMFKSSYLFRDDRLEDLSVKIVGNHGTVVERMKV